MRRSLALFIPFALVLAACGKSMPIPGKDMAAPRDMSVNDDLPPGGDDMTTAALPGKRVVEGKWQVIGLTSDDQIIYQTDKDVGAFTVPVAGGKSTDILPDAIRVAIRGKVVFAFNNADDAANTGDLVVWTAAKGLKTLGSGSFLIVGQTNTFYRVAATDDGQYILYTLGTMDTNKTDIWVAKSDGTGAKKVLSQVAVDEVCAPRVISAGARFFVSSCLPSSDMGPSVRSAYTIDAATAKLTLLRNNGDAVSADKAGNKVLVTNPDTKEAFIYPAAGGMPQTIDAKGNFGYMLPDGSGALLRGDDNALRRVINGKSTVLVGKGVGNLRETSTDWKYILFANMFASNNFYSDLSLASAEKPGNATVLSATTDGAIFGDPYTVDNTRVLYYTKCTSDGIGIFNSIAVGGGKVTEHAQKVWVSWATKGTSALYNDNYKAAMNRFQRADIKILDTAKADPGQLLVAQADVDFFITEKRDNYVYTYGVDPNQGGIWVAPTP